MPPEPTDYPIVKLKVTSSQRLRERKRILRAARAPLGRRRPSRERRACFRGARCPGRELDGLSPPPGICCTRIGSTTVRQANLTFRTPLATFQADSQ